LAARQKTTVRAIAYFTLRILLIKPISPPPNLVGWFYPLKLTAKALKKGTENKQKKDQNFSTTIFSEVNLLLVLGRVSSHFHYFYCHHCHPKQKRSSKQGG